MPRGRTTSTTTKDPHYTNLGSVPGASKSTPILLKLQSVVPNQSGPELTIADDIYDLLSNEMRGQFLGPMPVMELVDKHLPCDVKRTCPDIKLRLTKAHFATGLRSLLEGRIVSTNDSCYITITSESIHFSATLSTSPGF